MSGEGEFVDETLFGEKSDVLSEGFLANTPDIRTSLRKDVKEADYAIWRDLKKNWKK